MSIRFEKKLNAELKQQYRKMDQADLKTRGRAQDGLADTDPEHGETSGPDGA